MPRDGQRADGEETRSGASDVTVAADPPTQPTRVGRSTPDDEPAAADEQPPISAQELIAGTMVDHYRINRLISRGGMGDVYLARDTQLGRRVALKVVQSKLLGSRGAIERFFFEAKVTAQFDHPHIVTIHGVGEHQGRPYLALAYLEGQNLRERALERQPSAQETMRFGLAIAEALDEAHGHGILHRDLKPSNVVIGRDGRLRVVDFGLAQAVRRSAAAKIRQAGRTDPPPEEERDDAPSLESSSPRGGGGTPAYMAPEQWREQDSSPATDVWSLGVMLFELCAGRRPYQEDTAMEHALSVTSDEPAPAVSRFAEVPAALATLIADCLQKAPADRPTAAQVVAAFQGMLGSRRAEGDAVDSPFRGLLPFTERQADLFFGREAEIAALIERLRLQPVAAVVGPSGAGKSSFIQAGVVPRLREQASWTVLHVRPGSRPFTAVAARLLRRGGSPSTESPTTQRPEAASAQRADPETERELAEQLRRQPGRLALELRSLADARGAPVLLFVDQLEELFTLVDDHQERARFMRSLCIAADDPSDPVRVVFCARDDYLGRLATGAEAREALAHVTVVQSLDGRALRDIVTRPVDAVGYRYEDEDLVQQMVESVQDEPAGLPLLQFAAQALWEQRDEERRLLVRSAYDRIGGVAGALAQHADGILQGLSPSGLRVARQLLLRLVTPDRTRRVISKRQALEGLSSSGRAAEGSDDPQEARGVLARLVNGRLITATGTSGPRGEAADPAAAAMLELAHESLVRSWGTLSQWLHESEDEHVFMTEVGQAAELWDKRGQRPQELWEGDALSEARRMAQRCTGELPELVRRFLDAGHQRAAGRRRLINLVVGGTAIGLVAVALVLAWLWRGEQRQRARAELEEAEAHRQRAAALREAAAAALEQGDLLEARARLREALEQHDEPSAAARALWWRTEREPEVWHKDLGSAAWAVAFSPDGSQVAAACQDGTVQVLDAETRTAVMVLRGHDDQVLSVVYSPDGRILATGTWAGVLRLWDAATGRLQRVLDGHTGGVNRMVFSPDGRILASASHDQTIRLWDPHSGKTQRTLKGHEACVPGIAFSPDGQRLFTGSRDRTARLWDVRSGKVQRVLEGHRAPLTGVVFSPDGKTIASASADTTVRLWSARTGELERTIEGNGYEVTGLAYSPDGRRLATTSVDKSLRLWDPRTGTLERVLQGHEAGIYGLAISPDGRRLATASIDKTVRLWNAQTQARQGAAMGHDGNVNGAVFSPDGRRLASAGDDHTVRLWNARTGQTERVLEGHSKPVASVAFSPDGRRLASASFDKTVRLWDPRTGELERVLEGHGDVLRAVAFSPDGSRLASTSRDRTVRLWDTETGLSRGVLEGHGDVVHGVAFRADGRQLASASYDKTVRLWNAATGASERVLEGHTAVVRGVAFRPDGRQLASASEDRTVRLWKLDARDSDDHREIAHDPARFYGVAFSPDGTHLGAASDDGMGRLWSLDTDDHVELVGHRAEVNSIAFGPESKLAVTSSDDGTVRLWNVATAKPYWHAPALVGSPPRLLSHRGWEDLSSAAQRTAPTPTAAPPSALGAKLGEALQQRTRLAVSPVDEARDGGPRQLCLQTFDDELQLWSIEADQLVKSQPIAGLTQLVASPSGCAGRGRDVVWQLEMDGTATQLDIDTPAMALGLGPGRLLVATATELLVFDRAGQQLDRLEGGPGIRALAWHGGRSEPESGDQLFIGYRNGNVEIRSLSPAAVVAPTAPRSSAAAAGPSASGQAQLRRHWLEHTPSGEPTRLLPGPMGTLVIGYSSGAVGLWNLQDGALLALQRLHGPVVHLVVHDHQLFAASALGSALVWDLSAFDLEHCELLRQIWQRAPVLWRGGHAVRAPAPATHRCRTGG